MVERQGTLARREAGDMARVPAPAVLSLPCATPEPVLALGGYLRANATLAIGASAISSAPVGDLDEEPARAALLADALELERAYGIEARVLAVDLHPDYASTWLGERLSRARGGVLVRVQHHLAHAAAVLGEHGRFPRRGACAAAIVLDGTGFGTDGTSWGAEWLIVDGELGWTRVAHGGLLSLIGGERAVLEPWRVLVGALVRAGAGELVARVPCIGALDPRRTIPVLRIAGDAGFPEACGAGRVFEAAGALLADVAVNASEGAAAVAVEALARESPREGRAWPEVSLDDSSRTLPSAELLAAAARRRFAGEPAAEVAADLHATWCALSARLARASFPRDVESVALGGGCFANRLLAGGLRRELEARGFEVLAARSRPCGDGGLSYGQAVVASVALARGVEPRQRRGG